MSVMRSINDSTGKSVQSYQPVWMAHWMRTSERRDDGASGDKDLDLVCSGDHMIMDAYRSAKDLRKIEDNTENCRTSSKGLANEEMCNAKMKQGQDPNEIQLSSAILAADGNSTKEYRFISEGTSKKPVKNHFSANEISSLASLPSQEIFVEPPTRIAPYHDLERYKFDKGKVVVRPSISRPSSNNQVPDTKLKIIGQEHCQKHSQSADIIWDNHHQVKSGRGWSQWMQKCSHITSSPPTQCIAQEKIEQKVSRSCYDCYPQKFPRGVHETMRICTTVDSIEATPGGFPKYSQSTHSLLITKKTDVSVSEETDAFRRFIAQMNGNSSSDPFPGQANRGVKLQTISSSNSEGHGNVGDIGIGTSKAASKNESSAETDTMVMDIFKERTISGVNSTQTNKILNFENNLSPWINGASSREVGRHWTNSGLPAVASSSADVPTSSRTQTLDMDMPLSQAVQPEPKSTPSARWVKLLKNSSDCSNRGTKTLNLAESLSHEKKRLFFRSILNKGIVSSESTPKEHHGKETFLSDGSGNSSKEDEHFSPELPKKSKDLLLSHVWIKRWLRDDLQISQKKPETRVVCEPQTLKSSLDDLQKKQFPSIAAMALMGKSMAGLKSCELQKKGSLTIWKTNAI